MIRFSHQALQTDVIKGMVHRRRRKGHDESRHEYDDTKKTLFSMETSFR